MNRSRSRADRGPRPTGRDLIRSGLERFTVDTGAAALLRRRQAGKRLILAYHNVLPHDTPPWGDRSLHVPIHRFRRHLDVLEASATLVSLERLMDPTPLPDPRPLVALTFDDAYGGAIAAIRDILLPRGIPSTVFLNPGHPVGEPFWWDVLASSTSRDGSLDDSLRDRCLTDLEGDRTKVLEWAATRWALDHQAPDSSFLPVCGEDLTPMFIRESLVRIGSHGWSHRNLVALSPADLTRELEQPLRWLEARGLGTNCGISFPYGATNDDVTTAARTAGYPWGLRVSGGFLSAGALGRNPLNLPRLNIPAGLSWRGLAIRLSGVGAS